MFKWLSNIVQKTRIAFAYLGYERECRKRWIADARSTYSTSDVEQEIKARMAGPMRHVSLEFDTPIHDLELKRDSARRVVSEANEKLAVLTRDYKSELDSAYQTLKETHEDFSECCSRLSSAYDDLNSAKNSLDSWYSRANGNWIGNGGKKLPESSFFGQDLSDRDRYKSDRHRAASAIGSYKSERSSIARRIDDTRATIQKIKDSRQEMFDLKKEGFDKRFVIGAINTGTNDLRTIGERISQLEKSRDEYVLQTKLSLGVFELEKEIERLTTEMGARIKAFDSELAVLELKATHRSEWLAKHGE